MISAAIKSSNSQHKIHFNGKMCDKEEQNFLDFNRRLALQEALKAASEAIPFGRLRRRQNRNRICHD